MLLKLSIRNCLSYADEETFSLEAANLRKQHPDHVIRRGEDEAVRLAMIYGGNATGKSNLIKAVQLFIRAFRTNDCQPLSANRFALGGETLEPPRFAFTFHGSRSRYRYSVTLGNEGIAEERLEWLKVGTDEATPLFSRAAGKATAFDEALAGEWYTWRTLAPNMFLLRKFEEDGIRTEEIPGKAHLIEALDFLGRFRFGHSTNLACFALRDGSGSPDAHTFCTFLTELMRAADIGIDDTQWEPVPTQTVQDLLGKIAGPTAIPGTAPFTGVLRTPDSLAVLRRSEPNGPLCAEELRLIHNGTPFKLHMESAGTLRLLDQIATLWDILKTDNIWWIDEFDSFLHPALAQRLLQDVTARGERRSQIVLTTHSTHLLTTDVIRTDEVWFTQKRVDGSTELVPLTAFNPRGDKNLERGYLNGLYGSLPILNGFFGKE